MEMSRPCLFYYVFESPVLESSSSRLPLLFSVYIAMIFCISHQPFDISTERTDHNTNRTTTQTVIGGPNRPQVSVTPLTNRYFNPVLPRGLFRSLS